MARGTFNLRLSKAERAEVDMKAKIRGVSTGEYIRQRVLSGDQDQEQRIRNLERQLGVKG